jgi:hypothetical protein
MIKTDAPLRLWQQYPYRHNLSFLLLCISSLYVYINMMIFVPALFPSFSYALPLTLSLSLCVSLLASSLSPPLHFAYKPMANLFMLSLIAKKSSDKHRCFTQRAEHNTILDQLWKRIKATNTLAYYPQNFNYSRKKFFITVLVFKILIKFG